MALKRKNFGFMVMAFVLMVTAIFAGLAPPAQAHREAVGLFYNHLAPHGRWVDYGNQGPVWYPTGVGPRWRPYLNGRWTPASEGWMFETSEPWGWATYHYGNWFPTTQYGWVWSPGSTWYPSTAAWRSSDDYIGWAPIPPPDYVPEPAYYPGGGYGPGAPVLEALTSPLWLFIEAASFLLGFGQPYNPAYSYYGCGCMTPYSYLPSIFGSTFLMTDFYYPSYAPVGFYGFGPPFPFVSRVTNINITTINNFVKNVNITRINNALPPRRLLASDPALRAAVPVDLREGRRVPVHPVSDVARAERELAHPNAVAPPPNTPKVTAAIPKAVERPAREGVSPKALERTKGMGLPRSAERRVTPSMRKEMQARPQVEQPARMVPKPEFTPGAPPAPPEARPAPAAPREVSPPPPREVSPAPPREVKPAPREVAPAPREVKPAPREVTPPARQVRPAPREVTPPAREFKPAPPRETFRPTPAPQFHPSMPREFHAAPRPEFHPAPAPRPAPAPASRPAPAPAPAPHGGGGAPVRR